MLFEVAQKRKNVKKRIYKEVHLNMFLTQTRLISLTYFKIDWLKK